MYKKYYKSKTKLNPMIDPVAFTILNLEIRWYGVIFATSFLIGYFLMLKLAKQKNISKEIVQEYFIWLIPSSVVGARLWAVIFNHELYNNIIDIFAVWHGGMAIHGGILGATIATYFFTKKKNLHFYDISDIIVIPLALGLSLGRLGNFINQEFIGAPSNLPWAIKFDNYPELRHPSQIYESLKNLIIFGILYKLYTLNKIKKGTITWTFLLLYSILRFFVEFVKDMPTYAGLTYGQIISIPLGIISVIILYKIAKK